MNKRITPEDLKNWRKSERLTQAEFGEIVGWPKLTVTKVENELRKITEPEQRLLKLLIYGELPFSGDRGASDTELSFTHAEWSIMNRLAQREGYDSARQWIVAKIRIYLAQTSAAQEAREFQKRAAEDPAPYGQPKGQEGAS